MPYREVHYDQPSGVGGGGVAPEVDHSNRGGVNRHESSIGFGGRSGKRKEQWYPISSFVEQHAPMLMSPQPLSQFMGWRFGTLAAGKSCKLRVGWVQWEPAFGDTIQPAGALGTSDALRTGLRTGEYKHGNWYIDLPFRAYDVSPHFEMRARVWKGAAVNGSDAVELTEEQHVSNEVSPVPGQVDRIARIVIPMDDVVCNNEYLFFQLGATVTRASTTGAHGIVQAGVLPMVTLPAIRV